MEHHCQPQRQGENGIPDSEATAIMDRIVRVHSNPGDRLLDFFAGSGTLGESAMRNNRDAVLVDSSAEAIAVMKRRFARYGPVSFLNCGDLEESVVGSPQSPRG